MFEEWHNIAEVKVQKICDNSTLNLPLYVKIVEKQQFFKINEEHVRFLPATEYVNGFGYNAVTASYRLLL